MNYRVFGRQFPVAILVVGILGGLCATASLEAQETTRLIVMIKDAHTSDPVAARVYLRPVDQPDNWLTVEANEGGQAVPYRKERGLSTEVHTSVSAEGFAVSLPNGEYELLIERGKEYLPKREILSLEGDSVERSFEISRFTNFNDKGWYSGETHVHRTLDELPTAMLAENLNVALPLTYWVTDSSQTPDRDRRDNLPQPEAELIHVDESHVIWPVNTEYEIFTIEGARQTLGALFFLNHRDPLTQSAPPIGPIAESAREQGNVLLDLDKHNWPWSMMLIPVTDVDLYELTNNHIWRTDFLFSDWYTFHVPEHFDIQRDADGNYTERGWIDYGLLNYYMLLNCGFHLRPTAGTASGVHPVPLGFGRVYVYLDGDFEYDAWIDGLDQGHSFVTTGPLIDVRINGELPGTSFQIDESSTGNFVVKATGDAMGFGQFPTFQLIVDGVVHEFETINAASAEGVWSASIDFSLELPEGSHWVALRCFEVTEQGRIRFAHTAPIHVFDQEKPLRPKPQDVQYLIKRMDEEIARHQGVLSDEAIGEYETAREIFSSLLDQ